MRVMMFTRFVIAVAVIFIAGDSAHGQIQVNASNMLFLSNYAWELVKDGPDPVIQPQMQWYGIVGSWTRPLYKCHSNAFYSDSYNSFSDMRLKSNILNLDSVLDKVMKIRSVQFDYKSDRYNSISDPDRKAELVGNAKHRMGFIAQELQLVFPDLVKQDKNTDTYTVNYIELIPVLVKAIQEQQKEIEMLKAGMK